MNRHEALHHLRRTGLRHLLRPVPEGSCLPHLRRHQHGDFILRILTGTT